MIENHRLHSSGVFFIFSIDFFILFESSRFQLITSECLPDVISYNSAITCCAVATAWCWALHFFALRDEGGVKASDISFNGVIGACEKGRQWRIALEMMEVMVKSGMTSGFCLMFVISFCWMIPLLGISDLCFFVDFVCYCVNPL